MSRRFALTVTAALAASLAALAPSASAVPAVLSASDLAPLPLIPQESQERQAQQVQPQGRLTVAVRDTNVSKADGTFMLECGPTAGSHPEPKSACARLDKLAAEGKNPFAPVAENQMCTMQIGGPATARVTGTWQGRRVDAKFNRKNGCEISRWQTLVPVLPTTRA